MIDCGDRHDADPRRIKKPNMQLISPAYYCIAPQRRALSKILDGVFIVICGFSAFFEFLFAGNVS